MKKLMRKWAALMLALLMTLSLTACGSVDEETVQLGLEVLDAVLTEMEEQKAEQEATEEDAAVEEVGEDAPEEVPEELPAEIPAEPETYPPEEEPVTLAEDGTYTTKDDVALYIYLYGGLPDNFITKKEARKLGWSKGSLEPYAPGMCIGGDYFGNYEGLLPEDREYTECDIDTLGADSRGAKRIVFSDDGLIYYTGDHYKSFELLYGEE